MGQAPYGELNEKLRGASSSKLRPVFGEKRCWLNDMISGSPSSSRGTSSTHTWPSARVSAFSSGLGQPLLDAGAQHEAVDDDLDVVLDVALQPDLGGQLPHLAVDPGPDVALRGEVGEQGVVLALAAAHDGRQHLEPGAFGQRQDPVDDLLGGLALDQASPVSGSCCTPTRAKSRRR